MPQEIGILEKKTGKFVSAMFHDQMLIEQLCEAERQWQPYRIEAKQRLLNAGVTEKEIAMFHLQHAHWNWALKSGWFVEDPLGLRCFGIEVNGQWQGLVMIELARHSAELEPDKGKPLVYVEFLETAPWNNKDMVDEPKYGLIGMRLMEASIRLSFEEEFRGRVGLYALPQAEAFYRKKCGMVQIEGSLKDGMSLFELTQDAAKAFLDGR